MSKHDARIARALENVVMQLRRRNDQAEAFYREVLDVLTQAKEPGSLRSEQPSAAPDGELARRREAEQCEICGARGDSCWREIPHDEAWRWTKHYEWWVKTAKLHGMSDEDCATYALDETTKRFGPCPEES